MLPIEKYLYFYMSLFGLVISLIIIYFRKDLRREMMTSGIIVAIMGIFSEYFFFKDYWRPELVFCFYPFGGIEDIMFGFGAGAIGSVIYNLFSNREFFIKTKSNHWIFLVLVISEFLSIIILTVIFDINSIYSSAIGFLPPVLLIAIKRKDLIRNIITSAILFGSGLVVTEGLFLLLFGSNYLANYFLLYGKVPIIFGIFPLTEFVWGFCFGAAIGPIYDFYKGLKEK